MQTRILLGVTFTVLLGVRAGFPQAAAESVMLNAHSAAATTKAGSVLGDALNKAGNHIAGQIQTVPKATSVSGKVRHVQAAKTRPAGAASAPVAGTAPSTSGKPASGKSMITSIQGARKN